MAIATSGELEHATTEVVTLPPASRWSETNGTEPPEAVELPSITARLDRLQELNDLAQQREEITEALQTLRQFEQHPSAGHSVILRGANGSSKQTSHPVVIAAMVQSALVQLTSKLQSIENQLIF